MSIERVRVDSPGSAETTPAPKRRKARNHLQGKNDLARSFSVCAPLRRARREQIEACAMQAWGDAFGPLLLVRLRIREREASAASNE